MIIFALKNDVKMKKSTLLIPFFLLVILCSGFCNLTIQEDAPEVAPDFTLPDTSGTGFTLSSLRGKYVILDFWGTWCKICMRGMPKLKAAQDKYPGKFEIVGIDCGDKTVKWKHWVDSLSDKMPWRHVIMGRRLDVQRDYKIKGYPTKILVAPDGKIIKSFVGEDPRFYLMLDEIFGDPAKQQNAGKSK